MFRIGKTGPVYYLVAGRWFSAPDFTGPWTFASTKLPDDFKRIPLEHERSRVLASVPGTDQAIEAVLLAQVPQTARVNRATLQAPAVGYQGAPEFKPIEGTSLQRAVNTDKDIIFDGKSYYYCYQGVWFVGNGANGPWVVAQTIPASIYSIPASSPAHHVTYVTIEEDDEDNDEWVTFAYIAGYTGLMIGWGCAVWGSGWYYPPYYGGGIYYPGFHSYGYSRLVQPVDRRVWAQRRCLRTVWRHGRGRALQPAHRNVCARRGRVGTVRRAGAATSVQPAHRRVRPDATGLERVRQLGIDLRRSAATIGRRPIASRIARPATPRASRAPMRALR